MSKTSFEVIARWPPWIGGTKGAPPVAIRICLVVTSRPSARRTECGLATVARWWNRVTPAASRLRRYMPSSRVISASLAARSFFQSKPVRPTSQPKPFASAKACEKLEA